MGENENVDERERDERENAKETAVGPPATNRTPIFLEDA